MSHARTRAPALSTEITSYLTLKKSLGRRFANETNVLAHLERFLVAQHPKLSGITADNFAAWSLTLVHLTPTVRRTRMRIVRNFCLYAQRSNAGCFVPDKNAFPAPHVPRAPHIFTEEQILRLLRAAGELRPASTSPLRADVYRLAVVLLYTAGLRRGELVHLVLSDYDAAERTLLVRTSKFHKSRVVALSKDGVDGMDRYLRARRCFPHDAHAPLLVSRSGGLRAYSGGSFGQGMRSLFRRADVRTAQGRLPRVHNLRHTYAVHALLRWYRDGVDVQAKLPVLSTAMGHVSIASTAYYLAFLAPIAEAASERFAWHCRDVLDDVSGLGDGQ